MAAKRYIVKRETQDNGPMGSVYDFVATTTPYAGEKIYHGNFRPVQQNCGQFDRDTMTIYVPVGEYTEEIFQGVEGEGVEKF